MSAKTTKGRKVPAAGAKAVASKAGRAAAAATEAVTGKTGRAIGSAARTVAPKPGRAVAPATPPASARPGRGRASGAKVAATPAREGAGAPTAGAAERASRIHERLLRTLPAPRCELDHVDAWTLLVATILSAQSTDRMVNQVTPALFRRYPTPAALGAAPQEEVEALVKSTGFFRNKAKAIREASRLVADRHGGQVPRTMEEMLHLPGVARKTANVVLGTAYGVATGITVDTHAGRVARRLGLTAHEDPAKVEADLMAVFPTEAWIDTGHRLVLHGRYVCTARAPRCALCPLNEVCPSAEAAPAASLEEREAGERSRIEGSAGAR